MSDVRRFHVHRACPSCGYDLYSLPLENNIVRCTECGEEVNIVEARRRLLLAKLRVTKLILSACVGAFTLAAAIPFISTGRTRTATVLCVLMLCVWFACITVYVQRHKGIDGAAWVLVMWHISVGSLILGVLLFAYGCSQMIAGILAGQEGRFSPFSAIGTWFTGMFGILGGAGFVAFGRRRYRRMYDRMVGMYDAQME